MVGHMLGVHTCSAGNFLGLCIIMLTTYVHYSSTTGDLLHKQGFCLWVVAVLLAEQGNRRSMVHGILWKKTTQGGCGGPARAWQLRLCAAATAGCVVVWVCDDCAWLSRRQCV
mgnify:CR=1 FL=1